MAAKSFFSVIKGDQLEGAYGWKLTEHFACQTEKGKGYRITHIPTGFLLTYIGFPTLDVAKQFAELAEKRIGQYLDQSEVEAIRNQVRDDFRDLIKKMDEMSKTLPILGEQELNELTGAFHGQSA